MAIILLAMLGSYTHAPVSYWICYGIWVALKLCIAVYKAAKED